VRSLKFAKSGSGHRMEQKGIESFPRKNHQYLLKPERKKHRRSLRKMYFIFDVPRLPRVFSTTLKKNA